MEEDKGYHLLKFLVENGHTYARPHYDASAFADTLFTDGKEAFEVIRHLYITHKIHLTIGEGGLNPLAAQAHTKPSDVPLFMRATREGVQEVTKAKDDKRMLGFTKVAMWAAIVAALLGLIAALQGCPFLFCSH